jgi:hypothetical protein
MALAPDRYARSDVQRTVSHILGLGGTRPARQKRAMQYSRDVLKAIVTGKCTDPKFAARQLFKLWRKLGLLR